MVKESSFKLFCEGFSVEYNIQPFDSFSESSNLKNEIRNELNLVDTQINNLNKKIDEYNQNINRLTNFADGFDYIVSDLNLSEEQILTWIINLNDDIESLRKLRNKASHGGEMLSIYDAKVCFDLMVYTKKIMLRLVAPIFQDISI